MKSVSYIKALFTLLLVAVFFASCQKENEMFSPDSDANSALSDNIELGIDLNGDDGITDRDDNENDHDGGKDKDKGVTDKDDNENDNDGGVKIGKPNGGVTDKDDNENDNDGGVKTDE